MQSSIIRLAVTLATFGLGVVLATTWAGIWQPTMPVLDHPTPPAAPRAVVGIQPPAAAPAPEAEPCEATHPGGLTLGSGAKPIIGGVLNGKAIAKPAPAYPAAARAAGVSGTVVVWITVDECGRVESASAISGPELLQDASVKAAYAARFSPTRLSGRPVKVSGKLSYNYLIQ